MPSRLVSAALPLRTITRTAPFIAARHSNSPRAEPVNGNTTNFATLNNSTTDSSTQIRTSAPASSSLSWPVDVSAKALVKDRKPEKLSRTVLSGEQHSKVARAWEPVEKELWLERFGGPGKTIEKVTSKGTVLLREAGPDGKGYLRVLI